MLQADGESARAPPAPAWAPGTGSRPPPPLRLEPEAFEDLQPQLTERPVSVVTPSRAPRSGEAWLPPANRHSRKRLRARAHGARARYSTRHAVARAQRRRAHDLEGRARGIERRHDAAAGTRLAGVDATSAPRQRAGERNSCALGTAFIVPSVTPRTMTDQISAPAARRRPPQDRLVGPPCRAPPVDRVHTGELKERARAGMRRRRRLTWRFGRAVERK